MGRVGPINSTEGVLQGSGDRIGNTVIVWKQREMCEVGDC